MNWVEVSARAGDQVASDLHQVPREPGGSGRAIAGDFSREPCREEQCGTTSAKLPARERNHPELCRCRQKFRCAVLFDSWVFYPRKLWAPTRSTVKELPGEGRMQNETCAARPVTGSGFLETRIFLKYRED